MIEDKLRAVKQDPEHVCQSLLRIVDCATSIYVLDEPLAFLGTWLARKHYQVERLQLAGRAGPLLRQGRQSPVFLHAGLPSDEVAVHQIERLQD